MGARLAYAFSPLSDQRITLAGRVYQPLARRSGRTDAAQAVIGLELQPLRSLPLSLAVDRYVALGGKARDAWSLRLSGGLDDLPLTPSLRASRSEERRVGTGGVRSGRSRWVPDL